MYATLRGRSRYALHGLLYALRTVCSVPGARCVSAGEEVNSFEVFEFVFFLRGTLENKLITQTHYSLSRIGMCGAWRANTLSLGGHERHGSGVNAGVCTTAALRDQGTQVDVRGRGRPADTRRVSAGLLKGGRHLV